MNILEFYNDVPCVLCKEKFNVFHMTIHFQNCLQKFLDNLHLPWKIVNNTEIEKKDNIIKQLQDQIKELQEKDLQSNDLIKKLQDHIFSQHIKKELPQKRKTIDHFLEESYKSDIDDSISFTSANDMNIGMNKRFKKEELIKKVRENKIDKKAEMKCFFHVPRSLANTELFTYPSDSELLGLTDEEVISKLTKDAHVLECPSVTKNGCKLELEYNGRIVYLCKPNHFAVENCAHILKKYFDIVTPSQENHIHYAHKSVENILEVKKCLNCINRCTNIIQAKPSCAPPVPECYHFFCSWSCLVKYCSITSARTWKRMFVESKMKPVIDEDEDNEEREEGEREEDEEKEEVIEKPKKAKGKINAMAMYKTFRV